MVVTKRVVSSGGVIYKVDRGKPSICLIERTDREVWGLPKGEIASGESPEETAHREVEEETGLKGEIVEKLGQIDYWFYLPVRPRLPRGRQAGWKPEKTRYHKTVYFFLMKYLGGDTASHDWEVKSAQWFSIDKAISKMAYKNEIEMVQRAKQQIAQRNQK